MFRALYRTVLGPDHTRVLAKGLGRWRIPVHGALIIYAFVWAVVASAGYVRQEDSDGWWVVIFLVTVGPYVLLIWSPLYAWRLAVPSFYLVSLLCDGEGAEAFQYWTAAPLFVAVAAFYSRAIVISATVVTMALIIASEPQAADRALFVPIVGAAVYLFGARGRAERELEEERDAKAALEERARIAREMHDVVAHHMSLVVVRCETAPYRLKGLNEEAQQEFAEVGEAAREAITDMQRLLGVLRTNGEVPQREPQPGISRIPELVRPGDEAEVGVDDVPEAVGLTAYRIVQEALTNATRHAPGSKASVHVHEDEGVLEVLVINTAGGPSRGGGSGQGLVGMRERVAVHGGTLTVKSTEAGGFMVRARIPLGDK
ncbi:sensor histidine kinase [Lentzea californiensis]|uniref:sensor histidine kinase n=1 Tax=Lentzea californiensis TaxID=438851 RepID=UPI002165714B|nr:histidine kinase [Lentzea californiensis]MCR3752843.1 Signal transduction histidine kinase [Lentzea californiensis]